MMSVSQCTDGFIKLNEAIIMGLTLTDKQFKAVSGLNFLTYDDGTNPLLNITTTNPLKIGGVVVANESYLDGQISNLKIWNRALSAEEIDYLYNKEKVNY
jgi:hypothetical protein